MQEVHTFTASCVEAVEGSKVGRSAKTADSEKRVTKLLPPLKHKWLISSVSRSLSRAPNNDAANDDKDGDHESNGADTFVSANSSELRSIGTSDGSTELPSLQLSPPIFPTGILGRPPPASQVKIVKKLPFGYVIGKQPNAPAVAPALARKVMPMMAALHLQSRSQVIKNKVVHAFKGTFRQGSCRGRRGAAEEVDSNGGDEDVFWKKDVRGLRCRRVEDDDDDAPY